jgi:hypothetical protein
LQREKLFNLETNNKNRKQEEKKDEKQHSKAIEEDLKRTVFGCETQIGKERLSQQSQSQ